MIKRDIAPELHALLGEYPVVTMLGPRQARKTTLERSELPQHAYCNLESPEIRQFAIDDPKAFLAGFPGDVILDEIQRAPELLSYIQVAVDSHPRNGRYVLTGSHQLALHEAISQSLAGRTAILRLYPFSIRELGVAGLTAESFGKRSIKAPKIYFVEPGLLAFLLGIETPAQLRRDPLVGALFEVDLRFLPPQGPTARAHAVTVNRQGVARVLGRTDALQRRHRSDPVRRARPGVRQRQTLSPAPGRTIAARAPVRPAPPWRQRRQTHPPQGA